MVQTQSLTMLGYVGSPCADNRLASSFTVWHQIFFHSIFSGQYRHHFGQLCCMMKHFFFKIFGNMEKNTYLCTRDKQVRQWVKGGDSYVMGGLYLLLALRYERGN